MLFIEGFIEEARNLSTLFDLLANFLGLGKNRAKSAFLGFGLSKEEETQYFGALRTPIHALFGAATD